MLLVALILLNSISNADNLSLKYGIGFGLPNQLDTAEAKYLSLGYETPVSNIFRSKLDLGGWFSSPNQYGRRNTGFSSLSIGMRVEPGFLYVENYFGAAYLTDTDTVLGCNFEFTEEFGIGIKDSKGRSTGLEYRHFSNAGISQINKGRDFILVNIGIPL